MVETNLLKSLVNISKSSHLDLTNVKYDSEDANRIQQVGAGLEVFLRDSFCGIPGAITNHKKNYEKVFSWLGSKNNPPDAMLRSSDAIEIKKHENLKHPNLALNSSPPRSIMKHNDSKIQAKCKKAEKTPWVKDYLYALGGIQHNNVKEIIFCYGDCFIASDEVFQKPLNAISDSLKKLEDKGIELQDTNEIGKVKKIDILGYSELRIRGMWGLRSPGKIFKNQIGKSGDEELLIVAIMKKEKFEKFPEEDRKKLKNNSFNVKHFQASDPNDSKNQIDLVLVKYSR